jgi:DNA-binding response OmpR family regulator
MLSDPLNASLLDAVQPGVAAVLGARVMVLLEDAANAELLCGYLSDLGYRNVSAAQEPVTARQMLLNDRPDMLILDGALAAESGLDFLRGRARIVR